MNKKTVITGITGQDGSYLAEYLLSLDYEVHRLKRKTNTNHHDGELLSLPIDEHMDEHKFYQVEKFINKFYKN